MKIGSTTDGQFRFAQIEGPSVPRSRFERSYGHKTTFDSGYLIPVFVEDVLPGDTMSVRATTLARLATQRVPIMDNIYLELMFFFVPYRQIWDDAQRFFGERVDPDDDIDYLVPVATTSTSGPVGVAAESLEDYMGIPLGIPTLEYANLRMRAYNHVWNEHFRATSLQDSVVVDRGAGPDDPDDYVLLKRGKRYDYFTSCLPWPQRGDAVTIGIGSSAPVALDSNALVTGIGTNQPTFEHNGASGVNLGTSAGDTDVKWSTAAASASGAWWTNPQLQVIPGNFAATADLSSATAVTINDLRFAVNLQRILEKDARGGTRYTEILQNHFGVTSPDQRLQRPEFLGGGRFPVKVSQVPATAAISQDVGELSAYGTALGSGQGFVKSFTEHGIVLGLVSARADLNYQQGLERHWSKRTRYDFFWPSLSNLGEQAVLVKEIWAKGPAAGTDDDVFGYQERWAEYRYSPSRTSGRMRSTAAQPVDIWHLAQHFTTEPILGDTFIQENPPISRVVWDASGPEFVADFWFDFKHVRPIPMYSTPSLSERF